MLKIIDVFSDFQITAMVVAISLFQIGSLIYQIATKKGMAVIVIFTLLFSFIDILFWFGDAFDLTYGPDIMAISIVAVELIFIILCALWLMGKQIPSVIFWIAFGLHLLLSLALCWFGLFVKFDKLI